jgi:hypothetical protein
MAAGRETHPNDGGIRRAHGYDQRALERISSSRRRSWATAAGVLVAALLAAAPAARAETTGAVGGVRDPATGTLQLSVQASEHSGAGLRTAAVALDGQVLHSAPFADPACAAGACPAVGTVALRAPTTGVADGPHRLEVTVQDGAGRVSHVLDRIVTVANTVPDHSSSVTLEIGAGGTSAPSGDPPPADGPGVGGAGGTAACHAPRLSVVLKRRAVRVRRGLPLLARGKRHRFAGRLTCLAGTRRVAAAQGTPIGLRHWVNGTVRRQRVLRVGPRGRFTALIRVGGRRTLAFRARSDSGKIVRVRIRVGILRGGRR